MVDVLGTDMGLPEPVAAMQLSDCVRDGGVDPELFDTYSQHLRYGEVVATLREYPDALQRAVLEMVPTLLEQPTRENRHRRWEAAMFLGAAAHPAFIEVLRAVVSNPEEEADVRVKALHSLALIPDGEIVDFLISLLHDGEEPKVAFHAKRLIRQLADAPALGKRGDTLKEIKREYEEWWQKRREEWKYDRSKLIGV